jgi:hypothetical protein
MHVSKKLLSHQEMTRLAEVCDMINFIVLQNQGLHIQSKVSWFHKVTKKVALWPPHLPTSRRGDPTLASSLSLWR